MSLQELKRGYPRYPLRSEPASGCPVCLGAGKFERVNGRVLPCMCACLDGDEETRALAAEAMQKTVKRLRAELKKHP